MKGREDAGETDWMRDHRKDWAILFELLLQNKDL